MSKAPDYIIKTPCGEGPNPRWREIGVGWKGTTRKGTEMINVTLDLPPQNGRIILFKVNHKEEATSLHPHPKPFDDDIPF